MLNLRQLMERLGLLRVGLMLMALLLMLLRTPSATPANYHGWALLDTVLAPVLAPLVLMLLLLDALMSRVWMADTAGAQRDRYRFLVIWDLSLALLLLLLWLPYYRALFQ